MKRYCLSLVCLSLLAGNSAVQGAEKTAAPGNAKVSAVPQGMHSVTPYLTLSDTKKALEFYKKAFGAQELFRMPLPDGKIMHAEMLIEGSVVALSDEFHGDKSPLALQGTPVSLMVYSANVDKLFQRAVTAGAKAVMPLENAFWGDRFGVLVDPFGHQWFLAQHIEDVAPEEMQKRAEAHFRKTSAQKK